MDPILTVATSSAQDLLAYAGQLFTDLNVLILLAIGLPVGFWVVNKAIGIFAKRTK